MKKLMLVFALGAIAFASQAEKREHGAHVHGHAKLDIAFDDKTGKIDLDSPAESIQGFEYKATKAADKKKQADAFATLENKITEMVVFEKSLNCKITKENIGLEAEEHHDEPAEKGEKHGEHSDINATFNVVCDKSPVGTKITFNFQKFFSRMKVLGVQAIAGSVQKGMDVKSDGTSLELK